VSRLETIEKYYPVPAQMLITRVSKGIAGPRNENTDCECFIVVGSVTKKKIK
jgi:hypothetical protein